MCVHNSAQLLLFGVFPISQCERKHYVQEVRPFWQHLPQPYCQGWFRSDQGKTKAYSSESGIPYFLFLPICAPSEPVTKNKIA